LSGIEGRDNEYGGNSFFTQDGQGLSLLLHPKRLFYIKKKKTRISNNMVAIFRKDGKFVTQEYFMNLNPKERGNFNVHGCNGKISL
jgi:hypothetical protein